MPITFSEETNDVNQYIRVHTPQNKWRIVNYEKEEIEFDVSKGMAIDIKNVKFGKNVTIICGGLFFSFIFFSIGSNFLYSKGK